MKTCNGYTNRETWHMCLVINNDQGLQEQALRIVRHALKTYQDTTRHAIACRVGDELAEWVEEHIVCDNDNQFGVHFVQLITYGLAETDWAQVAQVLIDMVNEE